MASEHSESLSAQPLLLDFYLDESGGKGRLSISLQSLENGEGSGSEFESLRLQRRPGFWRRLRMSVRRRRDGAAEDVKSLQQNGDEKRRPQKRTWRKKACVVVSVLGAVIFILLSILNFFLGFWTNSAPIKAWTLPSDLLEITRNVTPVACHSHNDYWRRIPLYDALHWGCTGVEADVWLFSNDLFVGHSTNALTPNGTFRNMYVDPLVTLLDHQNPFAGTKNGIFPLQPSRTLVLLVDFKNDGRDIFPFVSSHLSALRDKNYLTYFNGTDTVPGPITVVATGNAPFDLISSNSTYRDIFFDAPLDRMAPGDSSSVSQGSGQGTVGTTPTSHFDSSNSYYASVDFGKVLGTVWWGRLSAKQLGIVRAEIKGAHERGLKARYWSGPKWPVGVRNKVWKELVDEGVDYLNGDDLAGMVGLDWGGR